jgi:recombinational DNA repair ATPase RecF
MAELDLQRRADLLSYLGNAEQVLLTTTDMKLFTEAFVQQSVVWQVQAGQVMQNN